MTIYQKGGNVFKNQSTSHDYPVYSYKKDDFFLLPKHKKQYTVFTDEISTTVGDLTAEFPALLDFY